MSTGQRIRLFIILEDRRLVKLTQYFMHFLKKARLKVTHLVMDMNNSYNQLLKTVFSNAEIVTDRFHIVQPINHSFNQLRIQIMNCFCTSTSENQRIPFGYRIFYNFRARIYSQQGLIFEKKICGA